GRSVDLDAAVLHVVDAIEETEEHGIRFKDTETGNGRRSISLPEFVVAVLHDHRRQQLVERLALGFGQALDDALVFPAPLSDGPQSPNVLSKRGSYLPSPLGLKGVTLHTLRHTHCSQLIAAGLDVVAISRRMGHANPTVTLSLYAHQFEARRTGRPALINAAINASPGGK